MRCFRKLKTVFLVSFLLVCCNNLASAQDFNQIMQRAKIMAELNAPCVFLKTDDLDWDNIQLRVMYMPNYFLLTWEYEGEKRRMELPFDNNTLIGVYDSYRFELATLTLKDIDFDFSVKFKIIGSNAGSVRSPSYDSFNPGAQNRNNSVKKICSMCGGKGWIPGSKTPTYGNMGTYWCNECEREVPKSHSHDLCPSCRGVGIR